MQMLDQFLAENTAKKSEAPKPSKSEKKEVKSTSPPVATNSEFLKQFETYRPTMPAKLTDVVIWADTADPPLSLNFIKTLLDTHFNVLWKIHKHSSLDLNGRKNDPSSDRNQYDFVVTLVWKSMPEPELWLSPSCPPVTGEADILRYFGRILGVYDVTNDLNTTTRIDSVLSQLENNKVSRASNNSFSCKELEKFINGLVTGDADWKCGNKCTIADAYAISMAAKSSMIFQKPKLFKWFASRGFLAN